MAWVLVPRLSEESRVSEVHIVAVEAASEELLLPWRVLAEEYSVSEVRIVEVEALSEVELLAPQRALVMAETMRRVSMTPDISIVVGGDMLN